jgi:hypothetical protein
MNEYNEKWTREKFVEYRKLKKDGYTHDMLKEHFGDDIWYSGLYNKNSCTLPHIIKYAHFVNEIKVNPEETDYSYLPSLSKFYKSKTDYIITFNSNNISYIIYLMFFKINNIETYNILFTTREHWIDYQSKYLEFSKNDMTEEEFEILAKIVEEKTNYNDLFPIFRKISWILIDFYNKHLNNQILSIGDTEEKKKINFYRNVIIDSFQDFKETETMFNGYKYFLYEK